MSVASLNPFWFRTPRGGFVSEDRISARPLTCPPEISGYMPPFFEDFFLPFFFVGICCFTQFKSFNLA
jgi:hypothetical protein